MYQNERSYIKLGDSYVRGSGVNGATLFGQESFQVLDYEVFKIMSC
jgi:hypothetical protein